MASAPESRLREIANFAGATRGLYLVVGSMRRTLIRQDRVIYVGRTGRSFYQRLSEHLDENRGDGAKLSKIEKSGVVTSIWLAELVSCPSICLEVEGPLDDEDDEPGFSEHGAYENLLIHTALRSQNHLPILAADHINRNGFTAPALNCVMVNRFNTDSWNHKHRPKWRPTMIPDIIDCHVDEEGSSLTQLIWTGTRGVTMQRRECRPGRLQGAARSKPLKGLTPTI
jgi:hypothetical protein